MDVGSAPDFVEVEKLNETFLTFLYQEAKYGEQLNNSFSKRDYIEPTYLEQLYNKETKG